MCVCSSFTQECVWKTIWKCLTSYINYDQNWVDIWSFLSFSQLLQFCPIFWGKANANSLFWNKWRTVCSPSPSYTAASAPGTWPNAVTSSQHTYSGACSNHCIWSWKCSGVMMLSTHSDHGCCLSEPWRPGSLSGRSCLEGFLRRGNGRAGIELHGWAIVEAECLFIDKLRASFWKYFLVNVTPLI